MALTEQQIKDIYGTLEKASQITGTPVQYPTTQVQPVQPVEPIKPVEIAADITDMPTPPVFKPAAPPDDLSLKVQLEQQRKTLEDAYQAQLDQTNKQLEETRKQQEEYLAKQKEVLKETEPLITPFREEIRELERKRFGVEEEHAAQRSLIGELDRLLTESIEMTRKLQTQKVPGLAGLQQSERMIKAQQNVQGRIAVIEAVMAARDRYIGVSNNLIDEKLADIQADRQDRISYLQTLFNFYEKTYNEAGDKIFNLTKDQKDIFNRQIGLLEDDLARAEVVAQKIKDIMLENPQMASEAGLSLSDTEEEITKKIADWQYNTEVRTMKNEAEAQGLTYLTPEQAAMKPAEQIFTQTDSKGVKRQFLIPPATAKWELKTIGGDLYKVDAATGQTELLQRGGTGELDEEKEVKAFLNDAANMIIKLDEENYDWQSAWDYLHAKYPMASTELIDQTLGGGWDPVKEESWGRAK